MPLTFRRDPNSAAARRRDRVSGHGGPGRQGKHGYNDGNRAPDRGGRDDNPGG